MSKLNLFVPQKRKTTGRRNDKVATQLKELFSLALIRGDFHVLPKREAESMPPCMITITHVDLSRDLCNAVVFFRTLSGTMIDEAMKFLELQTHFFKDLIAKKLSLRTIPNLRFKFDQTSEAANRIDELLKNDSVT
ncbi:MAG: 30S ribosome-binding factor RbfA [Holosporales bacterium]|jgi:ribosome-binding factor A|nr:30S ribosome-binding factor RbfA [Holosporales bacterium]